MSEPHKIKKVSATDQVYEQLRLFITEAKWRPGEKIPTETQLAEDFGVNRLTVRVALQRLQAVGLLDIKVGSGTFVKEFDMCNNIAELSAFYTGQIGEREIREYRYIIETECVRLAVERRTEEDLQAFLEKYRQMEEHVGLYYQAKDAAAADRELILQADMSVDIHVILCSMAHNALLNYAFAIARAPIRQLMLHNVVKRMGERETAYRFVRLYKELYQHIKAQDLENSLTCVKRIMNIDASGQPVSNDPHT